MIRSTSVAAFLISMSVGLAAHGQEAGVKRSAVPTSPGATSGQPAIAGHLAPTGKTLPHPGVPQASGTTDFDRSVQRQDDRIQESICEGC
jgi:hypothetical protein